MNKLRKRKLRVGSHVGWNSEAGRVTGTIIRVHRKNLKFKGYTHHATPEEPQYEIKSDKSEHVALHLGMSISQRLEDFVEGSKPYPRA
jgi:hypothetical protein